LLQSGFKPAEASLACWRVRAGRNMSAGAIDAKRDSTAPNAVTRPKERAARVGAHDRTLECERAGTSMLFGNLGAPAKARPEVPEVRGSESSKGHLQSRERSVTRTACMGESGQKRKYGSLKCVPESGHSRRAAAAK